MAAGGRNLLIRTPEETLPVYAFPEDAARVLAKCVHYSEWKAEVPGIVPAFEDIEAHVARKVIQRALRSHGDGWLTSDEVGLVLDAFRIPRVPAQMATTADDAVELAGKLGFPVAVKLSSRTIVHKTEAGGVQLNLASADEVRKAFLGIQKRLAALNQLDAMDGVVVQKMVPGGVELMIGVAEDPLFGPVVAFGLGGIHVEILRDVCFRITPLSDKDARAMIREIRGYRLLEGYRGHAPADVAALEDVLLRLSAMVEGLPEITDLDLNPIVALPPGQGCCVLDARIRVKL
jgi:acyl-CoA synthetase (NDP forming)